MNANYPIADNNRFISMASAEILAAKKPATWFPVAQDGTMDFGYDYSIHLGVGQEVRHTVRAQLKGTTKPNFIENGKTLSHSLERSTLNLYSNSQDEILLLLAVVVLQEDKKVDLAASKIYWQWIGPELVRLWGSRYSQNLTDQQTFTVHVPTSHELTPKLDIVEYLDRRIGEARATEEVQTIAIARGIVPPGATDPLQQLARVFRETPSLVAHIVAHSSEVNAAELHIELDRATAFLRAGLTRQAEEALRQLDRAQFEQRPKLHASLLSIEGKIAVQRRRRLDAIGLLERAHALDAAEPHLLALEELRFLEAVDKADTAIIEAVANGLANVQSDEGLSLLARVLVAMRRFDEANAVVDRITSSAKTMSRLVVMSGQSRWVAVRDAAAKALERTDLPRRETMGIRLVAARACWSQALSTARLSPDDQLMPLTGAAGLDAHFAQAAWQFSKQCLEDLKELGWQPNTELIAPIALASAAATGHHAEALDLMREAGTARPEYRELQENLELLAIAAGELEVALEANRRQPETHAVLVRRSMHLHHAKEFSECVGAALSCLATIDEAVAQTPMALVIGSAAASRLGRAGDAERLMEAVRGKEAWGEYEYFARFVLANEARDSGTPVHLQALRDGLERFPSSRLLAANLFSNLNASTPEIATEVVELAGRLRAVAELAQDDAYRLVDALLKLERWADAEAEAMSCIDRFGETEMSLSLLAVARELQGKTGAAVAALERAMGLGDRHAPTLRNYLNLCLRLGRTKAAQETIEKLLGIEKDHRARLDLLRLNVLCLQQLGRSDEAYAVVKAVGTLVRRDVEEEEGTYINLFMTATANMPRLPELVLDELGERMDAFSVAWPESSIFRMVRTPQEDAPGFLEEISKVAFGKDAQERLREFNNRERQARQGLLNVPFLLRPSYLFHYIDDAFTLWQVARSSGRDDRQYHLSMALDDQREVTGEELQRTPLVDLTALLVLESLGRLSVLFDVFPRIAISRATVTYVSQYALGTSAGVVPTKEAVALLKFINENLGRIDQPHGPAETSVRVTSRQLVVDGLELAKTGRFVVYCDDAGIRAWMLHEQATLPVMSTLDLLRAADTKGLLTAVQVGQSLAQLAAWNVGVTIGARHFLALVDNALTKAENQSTAERLQTLYSDDSFTTMARAVWIPAKPPMDLIKHVAYLIATILNDQRSDVRSAAALWAFWFNRLRLAPPHSALGWQLFHLSTVSTLALAAPLSEERVVRCALSTAEAVLSRAQLAHGELDQVVAGLGSTVGELGKQSPGNGERLRTKISSALGRHTHDGSLFEAAYFSAIASKKDNGRQEA